MCVPLTDVSKCPQWLALLEFILLYLFHLKAYSVLKNAQRILLQVSYFVVLLLLNTTHSTEENCKLYVHTRGGFRPLYKPSLPHGVNQVSSIPLGISKMHKKSFQISCPFWNSPQVEACVDCLINLLHVGNIVFLLKRRLSHCHLLDLLAIKWWGKAWNAFIVAQELFYAS